MLKYIIKPQPDGSFAVGYEVPLSTAFMPSCICRTEAQADTALAELKAAAEAQEAARKACFGRGARMGG